MNLAYLAAGVAVYLVAFVLRSVRWKDLVCPMKECPVGKMFSLLILGFFMNNIFPLRLGEFIRVNVAGKKLDVTRSGLFATVVIERLFDGLTYVMLFFAVVMFLPFPAWAKGTFSLGAVVFAGLLSFFFFLFKHQDIAINLFKKLPIPSRFRNAAHDIFEKFISGLEILSDVKLLAKIVGLSIAVWITESLLYLSMGLAFDIGIGPLEAVLVMVLIGVGAILPTAPGYVGTVEFMGVTALVFLGKDKNHAFGYVVTLHSLQLLVISILGIRSFIKEKITIGELFKKARESSV